jgi:tetratricopeptide (TPR) repeat protein
VRIEIGIAASINWPTLRPDYAEAISNLGVVLSVQGRFAEAAEHYQRAISLKPGLVDVYRNLARALLADGRADEALAAITRCLALGESDEAKAMFVQCAQSATTLPPDNAFRELVTRALTEGWGRSAQLSPVAATLFMTSLPGTGDDAGSVAILAGDRLLRTLLESAPVRDPILEQFLTAIRRQLLHAVAASQPRRRSR